MKNILLYLFIYLIKSIISQNNSTKSSRNLETENQHMDTENVDNPLVFNVLFKDLKNEWSRTMSDFVSQYVYMIPVPYKTQVDFYENITKVPCLMRGAFLFIPVYPGPYLNSF